MKIAQSAVVLSAAMLLLPFAAPAHTLEETNDVVRALLAYCDRQQFDNWEDRPSVVLDTDNPYVFFNKINVRGNWTPEGKKAAFNVFLEEMGNFDFSGKDMKYGWTALLAVSQCRCMNYTNALPAIRRLALNPTFPSEPSWRWDAIKMVIEQTGATEDGLHFVETILTNKTVFTREERGCACGHYIDRLLKLPDGTQSRQTTEKSIQTFYRHRLYDVAGSHMLDKLFVSKISGYEYSSNRLEHANFVLCHPDRRDFHRQKFSAITNQLLSSGQPLRQLTIDEGGNE